MAYGTHTASHARGQRDIHHYSAHLTRSYTPPRPAIGYSSPFYSSKIGTSPLFSTDHVAGIQKTTDTAPFAPDPFNKGRDRAVVFHPSQQLTAPASHVPCQSAAPTSMRDPPLQSRSYRRSRLPVHPPSLSQQPNRLITPEIFDVITEVGIEQMEDEWTTVVLRALSMTDFYFQRAATPAGLSEFTLEYHDSGDLLYTLGTSLDDATGLPEWHALPRIAADGVHGRPTPLPWPPAVDVWQADTIAKDAGKTASILWVRLSLKEYEREQVPVWQFCHGPYECWWVRADTGEVVELPEPGLDTLSGKLNLAGLGTDGASASL